MIYLNNVLYYMAKRLSKHVRRRKTRRLKKKKTRRIKRRCLCKKGIGTRRSGGVHPNGTTIDIKDFSSFLETISTATCAEGEQTDGLQLNFNIPTQNMQIKIYICGNTLTNIMEIVKYMLGLNEQIAEVYIFGVISTTVPVVGKINIPIKVHIAGFIGENKKYIQLAIIFDKTVASPMVYRTLRGISLTKINDLITNVMTESGARITFCIENDILKVIRREGDSISLFNLIVKRQNKQRKKDVDNICFKVK
jgi:hypothetical protein